MTAYTFVESMRQETVHALSIIAIPLMLLFIYAVLACLSERSLEKEIETRKYKRNLSLSTTARTKVDLEIDALKREVYRNAK